MKGSVQGWMMNRLIYALVNIDNATQNTKPRCICSRANKGRPVLLGVLFIPTARRATTPCSGVPACVEGVPARNRGSAGGAWLIDWPPSSVGVCGSSSSIAIATSSSEEGIGSGDEDMVIGQLVVVKTQMQEMKLARPKRACHIVTRRV
jgi:hypothetical protein